MSIVRAGIACLALCGVVSLASAQSLYTEESFQSLTADRRALRPGDSLTVLVIETSSASASANTTTNKTGGITGGAKGTATYGSGSVSLGEYSGSLSLGEDFGGKGVV